MRFGMGDDGKLPFYNIEGTGGKGLPVYEAGFSDDGKIYKVGDISD